MVFTSTTVYSIEKKTIVSKKFEILLLNFDLYFDLSRRAEITLINFVNISPTLVIDTSMESSSRVLQH